MYIVHAVFVCSAPYSALLQLLVWCMFACHAGVKPSCTKLFNWSARIQNTKNDLALVTHRDINADGKDFCPMGGSWVRAVHYLLFNKQRGTMRSTNGNTALPGHVQWCVQHRGTWLYGRNHGGGGHISEANGAWDARVLLEDSPQSKIALNLTVLLGSEGADEGAQLGHCCTFGLRHTP